MRTTSKPSRISRQAQNHLTGRESTVLRLAPRTQWRSTAPVTPAAKVSPHDAGSCHQQGATPSSRRQSSSDSNTNTARVSMPVRASHSKALPRKLSGEVPVSSTTRCPDRSRPPCASCAATGAPVSSTALCDTCRLPCESAAARIAGKSAAVKVPDARNVSGSGPRTMSPKQAPNCPDRVAPTAPVPASLPAAPSAVHGSSANRPPFGGSANIRWAAFPGAIIRMSPWEQRSRQHAKNRLENLSWDPPRQRSCARSFSPARGSNNWPC